MEGEREKEGWGLGEMQVAGYSASGKVLDAAGGGMEGVEVWMRSAGDAGSDWVRAATTGKGGQYSLKGVRTGAYDIEVPAPFIHTLKLAWNRTLGQSQGAPGSLLAA